MQFARSLSTPIGILITRLLRDLAAYRISRPNSKICVRRVVDVHKVLLPCLGTCLQLFAYWGDRLLSKDAFGCCPSNTTSLDHYEKGLRDVLGRGRSHLDHRLAFLVSSPISSETCLFTLA